MKLIGKLIIVFVAVLIITILTRLLFNFLFELINPEWAQSLVADLICAGIAVILSFFIFGEGLPFVEYFLCLDDDGVVFAEELEVVLHFAYVIDYGAVDVAFEEFAALLQHEVAAAQLMLICELCELLEQVLLAQVLLHLVCCAEGVELGSVFVGISEGKLADEAGEDCFAIV